ncbi:hypothetical protein GNF10_27475 [Nostoc sp. UCD121]|uniref:hypothetical protein n=1 Tax=unclassified Nostoc TaxID=2593658 RepID=UPI00162A71D4|nr:MULTISPECIES: hypothetical protein [unclassified Nostoc]MBC1223656.1 hypothetical protein [Nostoc sp. UCD120]MBC1279597.1 hypothetical protein [Nostoc sp. UCD121]MBC1296623.1 hypothetical protein [Nostoc sp. UCD122]
MNHLNEEADEKLFTVQAETLSEELLISQPLLPRSGWQDEQAFLRAIIRAKQALDMAELTALLWQPKASSTS